MNSGSPAHALLATLRREGAVLRADGDRLHVDAPRRVVTNALAGTIRELKPDLLGVLTEEQRFLAMSLTDFARQQHSIETRVPWWPHTIWFVPSGREAELLIDRGVARGRIWTAYELRDLFQRHGVPQSDVPKIARLKAEFDLEIESIEVETTAASPPADHAP